MYYPMADLEERFSVTSEVRNRDSVFSKYFGLVRNNLMHFIVHTVRI